MGKSPSTPVSRKKDIVTFANNNHLNEFIMKTFLCALTTMLLGFSGLQAQRLETIQLNAPNKDRGSSVMKALADRHSDREFANRELSHQDLSDLLWAAVGVNRPDGKRTAATALNKQDVDVYVIMKKGAYRYDAQGHRLLPVAEGDHRALVAGPQSFVMSAPISLLVVTDYSKFGSGGNVERNKMMGIFDTGLVSQNIALFCSGCGLATVPRATMDTEGLKKVLKLSDTQIPVINNPVGYPK